MDGADLEFRAQDLRAPERPGAWGAMTAGKPGLRRRLGFVLLTLYGVGVTIGAGIYVLIGKVAGATGAWMPVTFLAAAVLAGLTALSFAELSVRFPKSAGEALYVREGFGSNKLSVVVGLLVALIGLVSSAAIAIGAVGYIAELLPWPRPALIAIVVVALTALALWGILESVLIAGIVTVIEVAGLLMVIAALDAGRYGWSVMPWQIVQLMSAGRQQAHPRPVH